MKKLYAIVLIILIPYGIWKAYDFLTPDFCTYTDFRYDQHYYFQRYNSFWYGIYEYPSRKLFKKVYQTTPCSGDEQLSEQEGSYEHLSVNWGTEDVSIVWRNYSRQSKTEKTIPNLQLVNREKFNYESLFWKEQYNCGHRNNCQRNNVAHQLREEGIVPKDYLFIYSGSLEK